MRNQCAVGFNIARYFVRSSAMFCKNSCGRREATITLMEHSIRDSLNTR